MARVVQGESAKTSAPPGGGQAEKTEQAGSAAKTGGTAPQPGPAGKSAEAGDSRAPIGQQLAPSARPGEAAPGVAAPAPPALAPGGQVLQTPPGPTPAVPIPKGDPNLNLAIYGGMLFVALIIFAMAVKYVRDTFLARNEDGEDELMQDFQAAVGEGELTAEEYKKIKEALARGKTPPAPKPRKQIVMDEADDHEPDEDDVETK
jgi:hypothetical protein